MFAAQMPEDLDTARRYGAKALQGELAAVRSAQPGTRNATLNRAAFSLGQLLAGGALNCGRWPLEDELLAAALACGLPEEEARKTITSGLDKGAQSPRSVPERPAPTQQDAAEPPAWLGDDDLGATFHPAPKAHSATASALKVVTCRELLTTTWQDPPWVVPGLLPVGLALLAGRPKLGKSWLALQLTQAVATGGMFLGKRVGRGDCLYLALEDPPRRLAERMKAQGWQDLDARADFVTVGSLRAGGGDALAALIRDRGYRLVVIDTLSRALAGDQNDGQAMTAALTPLQEAAHAAGCAVVMVDHHNKLGAATTGAADGILEPDPIVNVLGSTAKGAMADCIMGMYRQAGKRGALLVGLGRDVEEYRLNLEQDHLTHVWQVVNEGGVPLGTGQTDVLDALKGLGCATCNDVAAALGKDKGNVYRQLQELTKLGLVERDDKRYTVAEPDEELL